MLTLLHAVRKLVTIGWQEGKDLGNRHNTFCLMFQLLSLLDGIGVLTDSLAVGCWSVMMVLILFVGAADCRVQRELERGRELQS